MSIFIYVTIALIVSVYASHPATPYTAERVLRMTFFWPLYAFSWLVHNLMKAFREAWSNEE